MAVSIKRARKHQIEDKQPPLKRRKLARSIGSKSLIKSECEWSPHSPSPSPPPILKYKEEEEIIISDHDDDDDDDDDNDSQISGILLDDISSPSPSLYINNTSNHHQKNGFNQNNQSIEASLSPSPPWGRSPSPPPSQYFHKPTKKKSRWDDKNDDDMMNKLVITNTNNNNNNKNKNNNHGINSLMVNSLIHSINLQQKKQQKVEPLLLDEHGNPLQTQYDIDNANDDELYDDDDLIDIDRDNNNNNNNDYNNSDDSEYDDFYDSHITIKPAERSGRHKAFKFIEAGTYMDKANNLRAKELQNLKNKPPRLDIELVAKKLHDDEGLEWLDRVPLVEWWDAPLLTDKNDYNSLYKKEMITDLIENPRILRPELLKQGVVTNKERIIDNNNGSNNGIPYFLTKKERKKMRRMKKKEEHQNRTDEIRLGLREPPEPRLKLSNIFRVLGSSAIRDPTAAENIVRAQIWKRRAKHELHNAINQLTVAQKREKKRKKLQEDTSKEVHVAIFVIFNLFGKLNKGKICLNAQQRNLTGGLFMLNQKENDIKKKEEKEEEEEEEECEEEEIIKPIIKIMENNNNENELSLNMVVVEGGPKNMAKYQRLLSHRIKWNGNRENCQKIWQGTVAKRSFQTFHQKKLKNQSDLKKFLKMHNVLSYWDMVKNSPAVTSI